MQFEFGDFSNLDIALLLQKVDRILAGEEKIVVKNDTSALAFSNPSKLMIYLSFNEIKNLESIKDSFDNLIMTKGLNYHELAHILYTDYSRRKIMSFLREKYSQNLKQAINLDEFKSALNILEDCRIENLFYTQYKRAKYYFSFCASNLLMREAREIEVSNVDTLISAYVILYGRKFLANDIRYKESILEIKEKLISSISKSKLQTFRKIVDDYIIEFDLNTRFELAYKFALLLNKETINIKNISSITSIIDSKSRRGTKKRIKDAIKKLFTEMEKQKRQNNQSKNKQKIKQDINALLKEIAKDIQNSQTIQKEINHELDNLGAGGQFDAFSGEKLSNTNEMKVESRRIENILRKLRSDLSTQIFRFQKRGKVDIISAIKSQKNHSLNVFKKERLNKVNKSKLGVCFLLDSSGSISASDFKQEIKSTFCLSKALTRLNNKTEIIEFSNSYKTMKRFNSEGDWRRTFQGGTNVKPAFEQAIKDLKLLRKKENITNLFIIIISDGEFSEGTEEVTELLIKAKKNNIHTLWICASDYFNYNNSKLQSIFDFYIRIENLSELSIKLKGIIKDIQKKINQNILNQSQFYG